MKAGGAGGGGLVVPDSGLWRPTSNNNPPNVTLLPGDGTCKCADLHKKIIFAEESIFTEKFLHVDFFIHIKYACINV